MTDNIKLETVIKFLLGEGPLHGYHFSEKPEGAGNYWWRTHLREAVRLNAAPVADGWREVFECAIEALECHASRCCENSIPDATIEALGKLRAALAAAPEPQGVPEPTGRSKIYPTVEALMADLLTEGPEPTEAEKVCYEAYQVVGSLLADLGVFGTPQAEKILDNLGSAKMIHDDVLPWPSFAQGVPEPTDQKFVAYLDIGAGGYVDLGTDLNADELASLPKGRHMLVIAGTFGIDGYLAAAHPQQSGAAQPALTVRVCSFPESNGKRNWTALLVRTAAWSGLIGNCGGITIDRGELWNRVAYEAERARFLIGERDTEPHILDYGDDIETPDDWKGETRGGHPALERRAAQSEQERKPMSEDELDTLYSNSDVFGYRPFMDGFRAAERYYGITQKESP